MSNFAKSESLKLLFCAFFDDNHHNPDYSFHLASVARHRFPDPSQASAIFDRLIENCDRVPIGDLKQIVGLPESNYEASYETILLDRFIDDLEQKVDQFIKQQSNAEPFIVSLKVFF